MKNILITGASGFIGSFLVEEALLKGYEVLAGVRKSSSRKFLQHDNIKFIELDFSSIKTLAEALKSFQVKHGTIDAIIHNAGITQANKPEDFDKVNYQYTRNLIEAVKTLNIPLQKFILISSLSTYGPGKGQPERAIEVTDPCKPVSDYARSKLRAAKYLADSGLPYINVHPTGVYGPRDKGFFQFIKLVNRGFEPYIGTHTQHLSLIYVKDLARAVVALVSAPQVNSSYLLSDGNVYTKEHIGTHAKAFLNKKTITIKLPLKLVQVGVSGVDRISQTLFNRLPFINRQKLDEICADWLCNTKPIWQQLNDSPQYDLKKGIEETIAWYKKEKWL